MQLFTLDDHRSGSINSDTAIEGVETLCPIKYWREEAQGGWFVHLAIDVRAHKGNLFRY